MPSIRSICLAGLIAVFAASSPAVARAASTTPPTVTESRAVEARRQSAVKDDLARYAEREKTAEAKKLEKFEGGSRISIETTTVVIVLLLIIVVILIT